MYLWNSEERSMLEPQKQDYRCSIEAQRVHEVTPLVQAQEKGLEIARGRTHKD